MVKRRNRSKANNRFNAALYFALRELGVSPKKMKLYIGNQNLEQWEHVVSRNEKMSAAMWLFFVFDKATEVEHLKKECELLKRTQGFYGLLCAILIVVSLLIVAFL